MASGSSVNSVEAEIDFEFESLDSKPNTNSKSKLRNNELKYFLEEAIKAYTVNKFPITESQINDQLQLLLSAKLTETRGESNNNFVTAAGVIKSIINRMNKWNEQFTKKQNEFAAKESKIKNAKVVTRKINSVIENKKQEKLFERPKGINEGIWELMKLFSKQYYEYVNNYKEMYDKRKSELSNEALAMEIDNELKSSNNSESKSVLIKENNSPNKKKQDKSNNNISKQKDMKRKSLTEELSNRLAEEYVSTKKQKQEEKMKLNEYLDTSTEYLKKQLEISNKQLELLSYKLDAARKLKENIENDRKD
jgi:hypothetical protein